MKAMNWKRFAVEIFAGCAAMTVPLHTTLAQQCNCQNGTAVLLNAPIEGGTVPQRLVSRTSIHLRIQTVNWLFRIDCPPDGQISSAILHFATVPLREQIETL